MIKHLCPIRVYYEDTDFSGLVYHGAYIRFLERGRTEFLRVRGLEQSQAFTHSDFVFVVRSLQIDFLRSARMDDLITVETELFEMSGASFLLDQGIVRGQERLVKAKVKIACLRAGRVSRIPETYRSLVSDY